MTEKEKNEIQKCAHISCNQDAVWKGTATKEDIAKIIPDNVKLDVRPLLKEGTWYYCDKHKKIVEGYNPHLKFEAL